MTLSLCFFFAIFSFEDTLNNLAHMRPLPLACLCFGFQVVGPFVSIVSSVFRVDGSVSLTGGNDEQVGAEFLEPSQESLPRSN